MLALGKQVTMSDYVRIVTQDEQLPTPPETPAFTTGYTPDRFQAFAIQAIEAGENVLVTAKTGSGKTFVGEYQIAKSLQRGGRVFYTTPVKSLSNQKFNDYIKDVCKLAEFTEVGRINARPKDILADLVSSHTARRSFATNYYLQGFPTIDLMKITGHRTERSFLKYIRVSKLDTAKRLSEHIKANWSKRLRTAQ